MEDETERVARGVGASIRRGDITDERLAAALRGFAVDGLVDSLGVLDDELVGLFDDALREDGDRYLSVADVLADIENRGPLLDLTATAVRLGWTACSWTSVLHAEHLIAFPGPPGPWPIIDLVRAGRLRRYPGREDTWSLTTASVRAYLDQHDRGRV